MERSLPHSWTGRINLVKMTILLKAIYIFNANPIKIPTQFFIELERAISKFIWNKKTTACYWYRDRQVDQWNRIEDTEINSYTYGHLIVDQGAKPVQCKKDSIFNKWCSFNWRSACRMQIDPFLSPCTKLKSKWIKELHIKPDTKN